MNRIRKVYAWVVNALTGPLPNRPGKRRGLYG